VWLDGIGEPHAGAAIGIESEHGLRVLVDVDAVAV
jgi:hypothetical protein